MAGERERLIECGGASFESFLRLPGASGRGGEGVGEVVGVISLGSVKSRVETGEVVRGAILGIAGRIGGRSVERGGYSYASGEMEGG